MQEVNLPTEVDEPLMVLFWSSKEASLVAIFVFTGFLLESLMFGIIAAFVIIKLFNKYEDGNLEGSALAALYWAGMPVYKNVIDAYRRFFI